MPRVGVKTAQKLQAREEKRYYKTADSYQNFLAQTGQGTQNIAAAGTYGFNPITRVRTLLEFIFRGSWVAGQAVNAIAEDMTRAGIDIKGIIDPADVEKMHGAANRLRIWPEIKDTIAWARLYGGALTLFLIDGQDWMEPLNLEAIKPGQFKGLLTLDRWQVDSSLSNLVTDLGPDIGLPKFYTISANAPALRGTKFHYTRCMRMIGVPLPYQQRLAENLWGLSVLERPYDRLQAFDSATAGAAQLVFKAYLRTLSVKDLRENIAAGGAAMKGMIQYVNGMAQFQSNEGISLIDLEDELSTMQTPNFAGIGEILDQMGMQMAGAVEMPITRLMGQSPAGFSTGDSELRGYYDSINQKQEASMRIPVTSIYTLIAHSEGIKLPKEGLQLDFSPLWQLTEADKVSIAMSITDNVCKVVDSGIAGRDYALKEIKQSSRITGIGNNISNEDIDAAEAEPPPVPETVEAAEVKEGDVTLPNENGGAPKKAPGGKQSNGNQSGDAAFKESEHPRADDGKFTAGGNYIAKSGLNLKDAKKVTEAGDWLVKKVEKDGGWGGRGVPYAPDKAFSKHAVPEHLQKHVKKYAQVVLKPWDKKTKKAKTDKANAVLASKDWLAEQNKALGKHKWAKLYPSTWRDSYTAPKGDWKKWSETEQFLAAAHGYEPKEGDGAIQESWTTPQRRKYIKFINQYHKTKSALKHYCIDGFESMNAMLRGANSGYYSTAASVKSMDAAFADTGLGLVKTAPPPKKVVRGLSAESVYKKLAKYADNPLSKKVVLEDKGFTSTSMSVGIASGFGSRVLLYIDIDKEIPVVTGVQREEEVILPRGSKFQVHSVKSIGNLEDGIAVHVTVVSAKARGAATKDAEEEPEEVIQITEDDDAQNAERFDEDWGVFDDDDGDDNDDDANYDDDSLSDEEEGVPSRDSMHVITSIADMAEKHGLHIAIETPAGQLRRGVENGVTWEHPVAGDYGYVRRTKGADSDPVDCFVGRDHDSDTVHIIDQRDMRTNGFDEHKCMIGYKSKDEALGDYTASYGDRPNERIMAVTSLGMPDFKRWLAHGNKFKPISVLAK